MSERIHQIRAYGLTHPDPRVRKFMQSIIEREERRENPPPLPQIVPPAASCATQSLSCAPPKMFTDPPLVTGKGGPHRWDEIAHEMVDDEAGDHFARARKPIQESREPRQEG